MTTATRLHWTDADDSTLVATADLPADGLTVLTIDPAADGWDLFVEDWEGGVHVGTYPTVADAQQGAARLVG